MHPTHFRAGTRVTPKRIHTRLPERHGFPPRSPPPRNAGTYAVSYTYAATSDFATVSGTTDLTVNPASPTVTATTASTTYTGSPLAYPNSP